MRKALLVAAAVAALGFAKPAAAQMAVIDYDQLAQWAEYLPISQEQLVVLAKSYNQLAEVYNTAQKIDASVMRVYNQAVSIYGTLQRLTNPNSYAYLLHSLRNPMPFTTALAAGYLSGETTPAGLPFADAALASNTIGSLPTEVGFLAKEITRSVNAISSFQAVALGNLQSLETRAKELPDIQNRLDTATTVKDTADITARLLAEQNYATLQQAQAQNLLVSAQMQQASQQQRGLQAIYKHNLAQIEAACAAAANSGMAATVPACIK